MDEKQAAHEDALHSEPEHALFDQTNGIYDRFADGEHGETDDDGNDLDADLSKFTGMGGNAFMQ
jgi:hypothetical protein